MILVDDSFSSIVKGVEEGRSIYANMQAFINFLISCNVGEVVAVFFSTLLGFPSILSAMQLLWVNLITDGPPATALGYNPTDDEIMKKPPRDRGEEIITPWLLTRYGIIGAYIGMATVGIFASHFIQVGFTFDQVSRWSSCSEWASDKSICEAFTPKALAVPQTLALSTLITTELLKALSTVSIDSSMLKIGPQRNLILVFSVAIPFVIHLVILYSSSFGFPSIADNFGVVPLSGDQWISVLRWSFPILIVDEALKAYGRSRDA
jgi:Ca2+-transporting ATPase